MKETVKFTASMIVVLFAALGFIYMIYQVGYQAAKNEQQPVIVYQVDSAGVEMIGKVTAKDVIDGHFYVEVSPYGKFLVTREQYEEIEIGQEMPKYLKGRGSLRKRWSDERKKEPFGSIRKCSCKVGRLFEKSKCLAG